jgi:hypothetical protein
MMEFTSRRVLLSGRRKNEREGEALICEADDLTCQSWKERMWSDGGPNDPSPTFD